MAIKGNRDWYANQGAQYPSYGFVVLDATKTPVNLTGKTLQFWFRLADENGLPDTTTPQRGGTAVITNAAAGEGRYDWSVADVSVPGIYVSEFRVVETDGKMSVYPNYRYLIGEVRRRIQDA